MEMIQSETKEDVIRLLTHINTYKKLKNCIYDDGCHLDDYIKSHNFKDLLNVKIFIDRFHIHNHKRDKCKIDFNLDLFENLSEINSQICEQQFSLISKHKHMVKHMSKNHFIFFFLSIFDTKNQKLSNLTNKNSEN
jgi:hypothetical protein